MSKKTLVEVIENFYLKNSQSDLDPDEVATLAYQILDYIRKEDVDFLSHEIKQFFISDEPLSHMINLVRQIFVEREPIKESVENEILLMERQRNDRIFSEMFFSEQRLKQSQFRRAGQVHAHLSNLETLINGVVNLKLDEMSDQITRIQSEIEKVTSNQIKIGEFLKKMNGKQNKDSENIEENILAVRQNTKSLAAGIKMMYKKIQIKSK